MKFEPLPLVDAWLVHPEPASDERGFFARTFCTREFADHGLNASFVQSSISYNRLRGTLRGMHFQWPPSTEAKLVRCVTGAIQDILLDLRPGSGTFLEHVQIVLDAQKRSSVYIPPGFAHGFQTLTDDAEVQYHMTDEFQPDVAGGFRWNDPAFAITLPLPVTMISGRDAQYVDFDKTTYIKRFNRLT